LTSRVSQLAVEVLVHSAGADTRVSQTVAEALVRTLTAGPTIHISQIIAEILIWTQQLTTPPIYPTLLGLGYSVIKRPVFYNGRQKSGSGWNIRVGYADAPTWEWDLNYDQNNGGFLRDNVGTPELKQLMGFYLAMNGDLTPFLFVDPDDNFVTSQFIGTTDGATTQFTLIRSYGSGHVGVEPIGYWNDGATFNVYLDGVLQDGSTYSVNQSVPVSQQLTFVSAPTTGKTLTVDMSYFFYVHFKDQSNDFEKFMNLLWSQSKITLESLRG
jgi:hypothetical protein